MDDADKNRIVRLAQEGKQISRIMEEDFPALDYWEVYWAAYGGGQRSAQGIKRMITHRLGLLDGANRAQRRELIQEIAELVSQLYRNHRTNSKKLDTIRKALDG